MKPTSVYWFPRDRKHQTKKQHHRLLSKTCGRVHRIRSHYAGYRTILFPVLECNIHAYRILNQE